MQTLLQILPALAGFALIALLLWWHLHAWEAERDERIVTPPRSQAFRTGVYPERSEWDTTDLSECLIQLNPRPLAGDDLAHHNRLLAERRAATHDHSHSDPELASLFAALRAGGWEILEEHQP